VGKYFYQTNNKDSITKIPPEVASLLKKIGLSERGSLFKKYGGWGGEMYDIKVNLRSFSGSHVAIMGGTSTPNGVKVQLYTVKIDCIQGQSLYLSLIINNSLEEIAEKEQDIYLIQKIKGLANKLDELGFAPGNKYLAKKDPTTSMLNNHEELKIWLEDFINFENVI